MTPTITSHPDARRVAEALLRYPDCLIATHINPEGDAIGSMLALALALEQRGITVACYDRDGVPEICRFLPTWERVLTTLPATCPPLVAIVDAVTPERCGLTAEFLSSLATLVRVDHHLSSAPDTGPALVDSAAAAAGELVFELLPLLEATLTAEIATCLLAAIMVDTGRFSYTNTTAHTLRVAAELHAAGADMPSIIDWTWGRVSFAGAKLLGLALATAQQRSTGRLTWSVLREDDFHTAHASTEDTEGIIDHLRNIRGTEVAALFSEKKHEVRVSLRSRGKVNVAKLAAGFNGGGHAKAAGITFNGPMDTAVSSVLAAIEAVISNQVIK